MHAQKRINIGFADVADERLFAAATSELFRENELLAGISDDAYAKLEQKTEIVQYSPREVIFEQGDPGDLSAPSATT